MAIHRMMIPELLPFYNGEVLVKILMVLPVFTLQLFKSKFQIYGVWILGLSSQTSNKENLTLDVFELLIHAVEVDFETVKLEKKSFVK